MEPPRAQGDHDRRDRDRRRLTLGLAAWIAARDFPPRAMFEVMQTLTALPIC
jgi:hypothetical protein